MSERDENSGLESQELEAAPQLHVMIVESDPDLRARLARLLQDPARGSYRVTPVQELYDASVLARDDRPDVLVLSLADEELRDPASVSRAEELLPNLPLLVVGPSHEESFARACVDRGASAYLWRDDMNLALLPVSVDEIARQQEILRELGRSRQRARELHQSDQLTGLASRPLFDDRLSHALSTARRIGSHVALIQLSLDGFKELNESMGHAAGDKLLSVLGERLRGPVRESDTAARLRGDEFAVITTHVKEALHLGQVANQIREELSKPVNLDGMAVVPRVSLGIARFPEDGQDRDTLLRHATVAMRHAKARGGNRYEFFEEGLQHKVEHQAGLVDDLRAALVKDELSLLYQPQVDPVRGRVVGAEALVRWQSPERGTVAPDEFLPLAEETGLIAPIGEWVLRRACQDFSSHAVGRFKPRVAVNVSSQQFGQAHFVSLVEDVLQETRLPAERLELEITESCLMSDVDATCAKLETLQDMGVRLAVDDFGTGFSSLAYLHRLPVDCLKIDKSFVERLGVDPEDATIVSAIVAMAQILNLSTVGEGVETDAQLNLLASYGCTRMQGYMFGKPGGLPSLSYVLDQPPFWWRR